ncbi:MAG: TolC family protein [Verrucomicrobiales bacterium]|nr:TolC family protein [Verrucomicrobiales bacterium]
MNRRFLILPVLIVAGCAHYQPAPLDAARIADDFDRRTLTDNALHAFLETNHVSGAWPRESWDLDALTLAAFHFHPDLAVARAQWSVATAGRKTAGERPNPTLSVSPAYNTTTAVPSPWLVAPSLEVPIETAGKRGYRLAQAERLAEAARLNLAVVAWRVRSRLRNCLVDLQSAREAEALLQAQWDLLTEQVRLLEGQLEAGAVSGAEATPARLAVDRARLGIQEAARQGVEARSRLAGAIGVPLAALEGVPVSFDGLDDVPAEPPTGEVRRQALLHRADLLAVLAEYAAAESALQLEIAKQYPDIRLSPGYEFDQGDNKWSLGLSVTLPVLNRNQGGIAEAEARRAETAATFQALQAQVLMEIDLALAAYHAALARGTDVASLLANLTRQESTARMRHAAGDAARSDVLAAQIELVAGRLTQLAARTEMRRALGALEDALQGPLPLPVPIEPLNTGIRSEAKPSIQP